MAGLLVMTGELISATAAVRGEEDEDEEEEEQACCD